MPIIVPPQSEGPSEPPSPPAISRRRFLQNAGAAAAVVSVGTKFASRSSSSSASAPVSLTFWKPPDLDTNTENKFFSQRFQTFNQQHKGVTANHEIIPWASAEAKYTASFVSGPPDVAALDLFWLGEFMSDNVFTPFESLTHDVSPIFGKDRAAWVNAGLKDGKHYAAPFTTNYWVLAINMNVWKRAGSPSTPKTYEEMIPFAQKLTFDKSGRNFHDAGFDPHSIGIYGFLNAGQEGWAVNYLDNALWSYGADSVNKKGTDIGFDNPGGRAALQVLKKMVDSGAATPPELYSTTEINQAFLEGQFGMAWFYGYTPAQEKQFPSIPVRAIGPPAGPAGSFLLAGGYWLTIPKNSKNQKDALELLTYIASPPVQDAWAREVRIDPVWPTTNSFWNGIPSAPFLDGLSQQGSHARLTRAGLPYDAEDTVAAQIINYINGHSSLDQMITSASQQIRLMAANSGLS